MNNNLRWLASILGLMLMMAFMAPSMAESSQRVSEIPPLAAAPTGGDFTLESIDGPVSTESYRGRVLFVYFGYTQCPDVCPTSFSLMAQTLNELTPSETEQVAGIFVSVDPKRDTLDRLEEYVAYFHPNFIGATGTKAAVDEAARLYGAQYSFTDESDSAMGYIVNHSAAVYLVDQQGKLRYAFPHATPAETMLGAIRQLFQEGRS